MLRSASRLRYSPAALHVDRDLLGRRTQGVQKPRERLDRAYRCARRVPAEIDVKLTVREPVPYPVRPVHGERGLAGPQTVTPTHLVCKVCTLPGPAAPQPATRQVIVTCGLPGSAAQFSRRTSNGSPS
jgi:hypothetical protein